MFFSDLGIIHILSKCDIFALKNQYNFQSSQSKKVRVDLQERTTNIYIIGEYSLYCYTFLAFSPIFYAACYRPWGILFTRPAKVRKKNMKNKAHNDVIPIFNTPENIAVVGSKPSAPTIRRQ